MPNSNLPLYQYILTEIKNDIISGKYKPGDLIPSENELAKTYESSRVTVRKALSILSNEDLIFTVPGKGNFVNNPRLDEFNISLVRVDLVSEIITKSTKIIESDSHISSLFSVPQGTKIIEMKKIMVNYNDEAIGYELLYSMYSAKSTAVEEELNFINFESSNNPINIQIKTIKADDFIASQLLLDPGSATLCIQMSYLNQNHAVEKYREVHFKNSEYEIIGY